MIKRQSYGALSFIVLTALDKGVPPFQLPREMKNAQAFMLASGKVTPIEAEFLRKTGSKVKGRHRRPFTLRMYSVYLLIALTIAMSTIAPTMATMKL